MRVPWSLKICQLHLLEGPTRAWGRSSSPTSKSIHSNSIFNKKWTSPSHHSTSHFNVSFCRCRESLRLQSLHNTTPLVRASKHIHGVVTHRYCNGACTNLLWHRRNPVLRVKRTKYRNQLLETANSCSHFSVVTLVFHVYSIWATVPVVTYSTSMKKRSRLYI